MPGFAHGILNTLLKKYRIVKEKMPILPIGFQKTELIWFSRNWSNIIILAKSFILIEDYLGNPALPGN